MLPSPACSLHVGSLVCGKSLDPHGEILMCATLPCDSWRVRHDKLKSEIRAIGHEAGVSVDPEPFGLFSPFVPAAALEVNGHLQHLRERQGLIPDLLVNFPHDHSPSSSFLCELKSLSAGKTWYHGHRKSVDVRASKLEKEYKDKARHIDQLYSGTTEDPVGPVQQKLESYGRLFGLVVGQLSECSQDLHDLLVRFADEKAANSSCYQGIALSISQKSMILQQYRRRLSVCAIRAQLACLLSRLGHFSENARHAAQRRAQCMSREEASRVDLRIHFQAHVRGRRLHHVGLLHP